MKPTLLVLALVLTLVGEVLFVSLSLFAQDQLPHRSAITPPPEPMETPFLHRLPTNTIFLHYPSGKKVEMFQLCSMQTDELMEKKRTNACNLFLVELSDAGPPPLKPALITPEDELVLSNHHRAMPQHP
jgi:hypothetical protein